MMLQQQRRQRWIEKSAVALSDAQHEATAKDPFQKVREVLERQRGCENGSGRPGSPWYGQHASEHAPRSPNDIPVPQQDDSCLVSSTHLDTFGCSSAGRCEAAAGGEHG